MTSFFRKCKQTSDLSIGYILISTCAGDVTDFPVVNVHVDELLSARIWQHKLCGHCPQP